MRTPGGPALFEDPTQPLEMLQLIRIFNPHDKEMVANMVRNFYEVEAFFKSNHQGMLSAYEFTESKRSQWEHLLALAARANAVTAGSVAMMTERERVIVLMSTIHAGYKSIKRRIDLGEIGNGNTMEEFVTFLNSYEVSASENRPRTILPRKIFAAVKSAESNRVCKLPGHTPGHIYGGRECNEECSHKQNRLKSGKEKYAAEIRDNVKRIAGEKE